jgi:hypothetical protein
VLRKLGAYPCQNALAIALRELRKLERTLFLLEYIRDVELRRRIHIGLNKGEARNALARAMFFNRLGELPDRTLENQQHRASGLNLVVAAIVLWNTVYLERAIQALRNQGQMIPEALLVHLSPLKWEHINLTGDYHWRRDGGLRNRKLRPLLSALHRPWSFLSAQFFTNRQVTPLSQCGNSAEARISVAMSYIPTASAIKSAKTSRKLPLWCNRSYYFRLTGQSELRTR